MTPERVGLGGSWTVRHGRSYLHSIRKSPRHTESFPISQTTSTTSRHRKAAI